MGKIFLPPGCMGIADGDRKFMAKKGEGGNYLNLDPADPVEARAIQKLKNQDYASAGLVDAGPEKQFISRTARSEGRWCRVCNRLWHAWAQTCSKCGSETIPEAEMDTSSRLDKYIP